jgi:translation initiation factor eIF-2B subunit alpha/methylthioribose-1-phosphate isomerase
MLIEGKQYRSVWFEEGKLKLIDQRKLPSKFEVFEAKKIQEVVFAIKEMVVRGAPAIGVAAAYGMVLGANKPKESAVALTNTRPTAVDLFHATDFMLKNIEAGDNPLDTANRYADRLIEQCHQIGEVGAKLIKNGSRVLTHCNAGALAMVDWGSALAPFRIAKHQGKNFMVWVSETRPRLQGSLTSWELYQERIDHKVVVDSASGYLMRKGLVDFVIVGADRVTKNGDVANKIGTYEKAVLARENKIPFYVALPSTTIDKQVKRGTEIQIELRSEEEILTMGGRRIMPQRVHALNPAFDVTPAKFITGYITDKGILKEIK